jgi:hypothetical protein
MTLAGRSPLSTGWLCGPGLEKRETLQQAQSRLWGKLRAGSGEPAFFLRFILRPEDVEACRKCCVGFAMILRRRTIQGIGTEIKVIPDNNLKI